MVSFLIFRALQSGETIYCSISQIRKPRSEWLSYLLSTMKVMEQGFSLKSFQLHSLNLLSMMLFWWKSKGNFFWGGVTWIKEQCEIQPWRGKLYCRKPLRNFWIRRWHFPVGWMCDCECWFSCVLFFTSDGYKLLMNFIFPHLNSITIKPPYLWVEDHNDDRA